jgi:hypothetical protein
MSVTPSEHNQPADIKQALSSIITFSGAAATGRGHTSHTLIGGIRVKMLWTETMIPQVSICSRKLK